MSFSYAAGVITQTGTDTSLIGLNGLTGVTSLLNGSAANIRNIFSLDASTVLVIAGTLTINPENEELITNALSGNIINVTGTLNIGSAITVNSYTRYSYGTVIHCCSNVSYSAATCLNVSSTGTLNWYGGIIYSAGPQLRYSNGSYVYLYSKQCVFLRENSSDSVGQVRLETPNYFQDGFVDIGHNGTQDWLSFIALWDTFKGYVPIHKASALSPSSSSSSSTYVIEDYDSSGGNTFDTLLWSGKRGEFRNALNGSDLIIVGLANYTSTNNYGYYDMTSDLRITAVDASGDAVPSAKYNFTDYDGGDRKDPYLSDITYSETADASGVFASKKILTATLVRDESGTRGLPDDGLNKIDYRSRDNGNSDVFEVPIISYNHLIQAPPIILKGFGGVDFEATLIVDSLINELDQTVVDAYTTVDDAFETYDIAKSYLYINYLGETETIISRTSIQVDLGTFDMVIDKTASNVFDFDDVDTITVKSDVFTGGAISTGTVHVHNDAELEGGIFDCDINYENDPSTITDIICNGAFDFAVSGTYVIDGASLDEVTNSSGGAVILTLTNGGSVATNTGPNITINEVKDFSITNIVAGSRIQIYNVTEDTECCNEIVAGTSKVGTYNEGDIISTGDEIRVILTYQSGTTAKLCYTATVITTSIGFSVLADQQDDEVYITYGSDGSGLTGFVADYINDEVDITVAADFKIADLYSWWVYNLTTSQGIDFCGGITAVDEANIRINNAQVNIYIDNTTSTNLKQTDNIRIYRNDGAYPVKSSGGGGIDVVWKDKVFVVETDTSGLTPTESAKLLSLNTDNLDVAVSTRSTFDESSDEVITDSASREASKAKATIAL